MKLNSISLRRSNKLILPPPSEKVQVSAATIATFNQNLQGLGYTLSPEVIERLQGISKDEALPVLDEAVETLRELRGATVVYRPMYPNFPRQVMEASDAELYLNALGHYFTVWFADVTGNKDIIWLPKYKKDAREPLDEQVKLTVIQLGNEEEVGKLAGRIAASNTSISEADRADLKWLVENGYFVEPESIPNKENLAITAALFTSPAYARALLFDAWFKPFFKTATDALRLATVMSDGDVSLKANTKFRKFKQGERRLLLSLLEQSGTSCAEDMLRQGERWIRLGERLHPGDYKKQFPKGFAAIQMLRNHPEEIETFNSQVEATVRSSQTAAAVKLLGKRPGEFARRLDHLVRISQESGEPGLRKMQLVVDGFDEVANEISTPVLLQVMAHFQNRNNLTTRVVFPKGNIARVQAIYERREQLPQSVTDQLVSVCVVALKRRFHTLGKLGKVYVDPQLKGYLVPFSQRSASRSLRTLVRGSRIEFANDKNTLRFFVYWTDEEVESSGADGRRVDIDLSALFYGPEWNLLEQIAYYNLRSNIDSGLGLYHSGDITSAPQGACEFIDVDIPKAVKKGIRYVVMDIRSFTEQKFSNLPVVFAGWMLREKQHSGEVFEPKTVVDRVDIAMEATAGMPMIVDLVERKVIWVDVATPGKGGRFGKRKLRGNNALNNLDAIALIATAFTKMAKPNLYDLFSLHASARGTQVETPEEADIKFSVEVGTPFELEKIAADFLLNAAPTLVEKTELARSR